LQALLKGMYPSNNTPAEIQRKSNKLYQLFGIQPFLTILKKEDPETFYQLHRNDHYRIRRAIEHFWATGYPFSAAKRKWENLGEKTNKNKWNVLHCYLDLPKERHFQYIQQRTRKMLEQGLVEEVEELLNDSQIKGNERPLQSIGHKQVIQYLKGEIKSLEECENRINIATRQLAKSQRTWFKKVTDKFCFEADKAENLILEKIQQFLSE
jgi:tRNA dimethylallyltransferase